MNQIKKIIYIVIIFCSSFAAAQVTFNAKVSKTKLGINERLRIEFVMNKDGDNFKPPSFDHFTVVGGPSQSIRTSSVNGRLTFSKSYSYFLSPKKRGTFSIGQAEIEIEGKVYKTAPVKITVTTAVEKPKDPNDPNYVASQNIHLVAEVSKTNPYINEPITVVYKLYISPRIGISNIKELDNPEYNNFWSQTIKSQGISAKNGTYNGEEYRFIEWSKTVLYPQKSGTLIIEPLTLDISVEVPTNRRHIFGGRETRTVQRKISAGKRNINVKPLPEEDKPLNFNGAVGRFKLKVTTSKEELKATEALQTKIEISGKGNLKLFQLPELVLPSALEVYEPEHKENITTKFSGMQGKISDSYTIVPSYQGRYPIPSISFSYFDLETEQYKTLTSSELIINVNEGPINDNTLSNNNAIENKKKVTLTGNQFASFKIKTKFTSTTPSYFFKSNLFWSSLLLPLLAIPLAIVIRRKKDEREQDIVGNKLRRANKLAKKYLGEAKKSLGNKDIFYNALERALYNYLKAKLNIEASEFSKERIQELLVSKDVEQDTVLEFTKLLKNCELARYTPFTDVEMQEDYIKAAQVISAIDKQARK